MLLHRFVFTPIVLALASLLTILSFQPILRAEEVAPKATPAAPVAPAAPAQTDSSPEGSSKDAPATLLPVAVTETIVTTPARIATPITQTGVSVTVIDGKENSQTHQNIELGESLRQTPGISVNKSGFNGDFTTLFTRGGNSNQTLFLYDGFKVNRQGGNFNLGPVDPVQIERIEIARGPSSSLYGADAVTGTINVISAKGEGRPDLTVSGAGGTYGTDRETVQMQGSEKNFSYNISSSRYHRTEAEYANSAASIYNYAGRFDYKIDDCNSLKLVVRGLDEKKGFYEDSGSGYGPIVEVVDPNDKLLENDLLVGVEYKSHLLPIWDMTLRAGNYAINYHVESPGPNPDSKFGGFPQPIGRTYAKERRPQFGWQNDITAFENESGDIKDVVTAGADFEEDLFDQKDSQFGNNVRRQRNNWSIYVQDRLELFQRAYLTGGVRREQNQQFGEFLTGRGDASILIPESCSRVHGSVGNAFRAPSFFEFFTAFGNPNLKPEKNMAYDAGFEQSFWCKRITCDATFFHNRFTDLINFNGNGTFENLRHAETRGFEFSAEIKPIDMLTIRGTSTLLHTQDDKGQHLLRRPGETYTASAIARPICGLELSLDMIHEGPRTDLGPAPGNDFGHVVNHSFTRLDAAASYRFLCHWRVFGKVENLTDERYQEVKTFPSAGSNFLGGVEFNWKF